MNNQKSLLPSFDTEKNPLKNSFLFESLGVNPFKTNGLNRSGVSELQYYYNQDEPVSLLKPLSVNSSCFIIKKGFQAKLVDSETGDKNDFYYKPFCPNFSERFQGKLEDHILLEEEQPFIEDQVVNFEDNIVLTNQPKESKQFLFNSSMSNSEKEPSKINYKGDSLIGSLIVAHPNKITAQSPPIAFNMMSGFFGNANGFEPVVTNKNGHQNDKTFPFDGSIFKSKVDCSPGTPPVLFNSLVEAAYKKKPMKYHQFESNQKSLLQEQQSENNKAIPNEPKESKKDEELINNERFEAKLDELIESYRMSSKSKQPEYSNDGQPWQMMLNELQESHRKATRIKRMEIYNKREASCTESKEFKESAKKLIRHKRENPFQEKEKTTNQIINDSKETQKKYQKSKRGENSNEMKAINIDKNETKEAFKKSIGFKKIKVSQNNSVLENISTELKESKIQTHKAKKSETSESSEDDQMPIEEHKFTNMETFLIHFFADQKFTKPMCVFNENESLVLSSLFARKYELKLQKR